MIYVYVRPPRTPSPGGWADREVQIAAAMTR